MFPFASYMLITFYTHYTGWKGTINTTYPPVVVFPLLVCIFGIACISLPALCYHVKHNRISNQNVLARFRVAFNAKRHKHAKCCAVTSGHSDAAMSARARVVCAVLYRLRFRPDVRGGLGRQTFTPVQTMEGLRFNIFGCACPVFE